MRAVIAVEMSLMLEMGGVYHHAVSLARMLDAELEARCDYAGLIRFDEMVRGPSFDHLQASRAGSYGANIETAIRAGVDLLSGPGRLVLISSLTPGAHYVPGHDDRPFFAWPPSRETLRLTHVAVSVATEQQVTIDALKLGDGDPYSLELVADIEGSGGYVQDVDRDDVDAALTSYLATRWPPAPVSG